MSTPRIALVGYGRVGRALSRLLSFYKHDYQIFDPACIPEGQFMRDPFENDPQVIFSAVPGRHGYEFLAQCAARKNLLVFDCSYMPEDYYELGNLAVANNTKIIADCGLAPGLSNIFVQWLWDEAPPERRAAFRTTIFVGGLPLRRDAKNPDPQTEGNYYTTFNEQDCFGQFEGRARYVKDGNIIDESIVDNVQVDHLFEYWPTDGLHSLLDTQHHKELREYTIRWRGFGDLLMAYRQGKVSSADLAWPAGSREGVSLTVSQEDNTDQIRMLTANMEGDPLRQSIMALSTAILPVYLYSFGIDYFKTSGVRAPEEVAPCGEEHLAGLVEMYRNHGMKIEYHVVTKERKK